MDLLLPRLLTQMIATGRWPKDGAAAARQNVKPLASRERVLSLLPTQEPGELFLYPPPFRTIAERVATGEEFWNRPWSRPEGLDREKAVLIADFGFGSDASIVLDYPGASEEPSVRYLRAMPQPRERLGTQTFGERNAWRVLAPTFDAFVELLGL